MRKGQGFLPEAADHCRFQARGAVNHGTVLQGFNTRGNKKTESSSIIVTSYRTPGNPEQLSCSETREAAGPCRNGKVMLH